MSKTNTASTSIGKKDVSTLAPLSDVDQGGKAKLRVTGKDPRKYLDYLPLCTTVHTGIGDIEQEGNSQVLCSILPTHTHTQNALLLVHAGR
ncbi:hypothetical protein P5673_021082 [Acropora cervicornis]|uniref:Uncharacterized protein n=1 Tax=Acropora cervicornis TaxID=6130 RepID=A0AAD9Q9N5_ACRCE|nr:hypothetical protein P5673_021082 [Acropora cervicornis]